MEKKEPMKILYKNVKGQQMKYHLDNAIGGLKVENPNFHSLTIVKVELDAFIELIPNEGEVADYLREKLTELDNTYNEILTTIQKQYDEGGYLEKTDCVTAKMQNQFVYLLKKYYLCNNTYERFKLYEDDSIIDYIL